MIYLEQKKPFLYNNQSSLVHIQKVMVRDGTKGWVPEWGLISHGVLSIVGRLKPTMKSGSLNDIIIFPVGRKPKPNNPFHEIHMVYEVA